MNVADAKISRAKTSPARIAPDTAAIEAEQGRLVEITRKIDQAFSRHVTGIPDKAMALLEKIERNTRYLVKFKPYRSTLVSPPPVATARRARRVSRTFVPTGRPPKSATRIPKEPGKPGYPTTTASEASKSVTVKAAQADARRSVKQIELPAQRSAGEQEKRALAKGSSQSALALQRQKKAQREQAKVISESVRKGIDGWGLVKGALGQMRDIARAEDTADIAGTAAGGPIWEAIKEVKEATENVRAELTDDEAFLGKMFNKAKGWLKDGSKPKVPVGWKKDKAGRWRDAQGKYISKDKLAESGLDKKDAIATRVRDKKRNKLLDEQLEIDEEQLESTNEIIDLLLDKEKDDKKRHKKLVKAVVKGGDGGVLDGVGNLVGPGKFKGLLRMFKGSIFGGLAGFGKILKPLPGALAGLTAGLTGLKGLLKSLGGAGVAGKAAKSTLSKVMPKVGAKRAAKLAAKGALKGMRALGPLAAVGLSAYDAVSGFNDNQMQAKAFDLNPGEAATIGEKFSSAVANVIDFGGLGTGLANMLGFAAETADIAEAIHKAGKRIARSFGFGLKKENAKPVAKDLSSSLELEAPFPTPITPKDESRAKGTTQKDEIDKELVSVLKRLMGALKSNMGGHKPSSQPKAPEQNIPDQFDDIALTLMAHDAM